MNFPVIVSFTVLRIQYFTEHFSSAFIYKTESLQNSHFSPFQLFPFTVIHDQLSCIDQLSPKSREPASLAGFLTHHVVL